MPDKMNLNDLLRFGARVEVVSNPNDCWKWLGGGYRGKGYGALKSAGKNVGASRIAYELAYGAIPQGLIVMHRCDNPGCVRPSHLMVGTHQDNAADRDAKGRHARLFGDANPMRLHPECRIRGERVNTAKLTESQVKEIRGLHSSGVSQIVLSRMYRVWQSTIWKVVHCRTWTHIIKMP